MKKHHILLILLLVGIAAFFLNEGRKLKSTESNARDELNMLRDAVKKSPAAATASNLTGRRSRPPALDTAKFNADLTDILKNGQDEETRKSMEDFLKNHQAQIASAPVSKLKEICALLEKDFPLKDKDSEIARDAWLFIVGEASKSDPSWAFGKLDQAAAAVNVPIGEVLQGLKAWSSQDGKPMSLSYATALKKWLDAAEAGGRIGENTLLLAGLRTDIATAEGNSSAAVKQLSQLPYLRQQQAAIDYVDSLQTPEAQRQAMKEFSTALDAQNFPKFVREFTHQQGFEAAKGILESASLLPEKHDLAAAGIAAANIGSETKDRAAWLLENLKTDGYRALEEFTETWTGKNHTDAAHWITTLQPGPKRDAALKGFIPAVARIDGATSMDWALTVSDPLLRNQMYTESYVKWAEIDPDQAKIYRTAHPLDHEALDAGGK